jgi:hypothetical protein
VVAVDIQVSDDGVRSHGHPGFQDLGLVLAVVVGSVLRLWDLGRTPPITDEAYTLLALRLPVGEMIRHLDRTDPHPPLAYLLLRPFAAFTSDPASLRTVSAFASIGALVIMAIWRRRAGIAGLTAVALLAIAPFQLGYGREVRMYGLLCLAGVAAAWCTDRWLLSAKPGWAVGAIAAGTVVAFGHAAGVLMLLALLVVPLRRVDRAALQFRALNLAALVAFALLWGRHALHWSGASGNLPTASPGWAAIVVNELVAPAPDQRWLVVPIVLLGAILVVRRGGSLARVWLCLFAVPFGVLFLASLHRGVLVPRTLMPFSWAVPIALGAVVGWAWARSRSVGAAVVILLLVLVVPLVGPALEQGDGSSAAIGSVYAGAAPADGFAFAASAWQPDSLLRYYAEAAGRPDLAPVAGVEGGMTVLAADGTPPPRVWYVAVAPAGPPEGSVRCGDTRTIGSGLTVTCLEFPVDGGSDDDAP